MTRSSAAGAGLVAIGMALSLLSRFADGFVQGLLLGAGLMMLVIGVITLSARVRGQLRGLDEDGEGSGTWLPSRDGDR